MDKETLKILTSSKSDSWGTPQDFFNELNSEFNFTLDPCCAHWNHKCRKYYTEEDDGLSKSWEGEIVFLNPPYSQSKLWIIKAAKEKCVSVLLLPSRTDTKVFHEYIYNKPNAEIRFIKGRLKFETGDSRVKNSAPFPSMLVIFRNV